MALLWRTKVCLGPLPPKEVVRVTQGIGAGDTGSVVHPNLYKSKYPAQDLNTSLFFLNFSTVQYLLVSQGCCHKVSQIEWLKQQKCIVSRIWRLEVWDQASTGWVLLSQREDLF